MKWLTPLALTTPSPLKSRLNSSSIMNSILDWELWPPRFISVHPLSHQFQLHWTSHLWPNIPDRDKKGLTVEARLWLPFSRCPFLSLWSVEVESRMSHILSPIRLSLLVWNILLEFVSSQETGLNIHQTWVFFFIWNLNEISISSYLHKLDKVYVNALWILFCNLVVLSLILI